VAHSALHWRGQKMATSFGSGRRRSFFLQFFCFVANSSQLPSRSFSNKYRGSLTQAPRGVTVGADVVSVTHLFLTTSTSHFLFLVQVFSSVFFPLIALHLFFNITTTAADTQMFCSTMHSLFSLQVFLSIFCLSIAAQSFSIFARTKLLESNINSTVVPTTYQQVVESFMIVQRCRRRLSSLCLLWN